MLEIINIKCDKKFSNSYLLVINNKKNRTQIYIFQELLIVIINYKSTSHDLRLCK